MPIVVDLFYIENLFLKEDLLKRTSEVETRNKSLIVINFKKIVWKNLYLIDIVSVINNNCRKSMVYKLTYFYVY